MPAAQSPKLDRLLSCVERELPGSPRARELCARLLSATGYDRDFVHQLFAVARGRGTETWEVRRLAALMLQRQALEIAADDFDEHDFFLTELGLKRAGDAEVAASVTREGYNTTHFRGFLLEFRRRLSRLDRVLAEIRGRRTSRLALEDFLHLSRRECKLALGRYLFTAEEVAQRIVRQLRRSKGSPSRFCQEEVGVSRELARTLALLPDYEAAVLRELHASPVIYWVAEDTSSEINSLVEYPLGTVVLVVKLPGSELELEIKRAGRRDDRPLGVVFQRRGFLVANMHRLDGGSSVHYLRHEAAAAARFSDIYHRVHRGEAPVSRTFSITGVWAVPVNGSEAPLFDYFTAPEIFGDEYRDMRRAMRQSIRAFEHEWGAEAKDLPGDLGLTVQFLAQIPPAQALLAGSTSFRLDRLSGYLSAEGPRMYFEEGLGIAYSADDARRFADEVLEEVLAIYTPPPVAYRDHEQYLEAAFAVRENRARADRQYRSVLRQIGLFWGTLLAVRGHSRGESVVARNVGLRSVWKRGRWTVEVVFMDHDSLYLPHDFDPEDAVWGMMMDWRFLGAVEGRSSLEHLTRIYRPDDEVHADGQQALHASMETSYRKTRAAMESDKALRTLFEKSHLDASRRFDQLVASYLEARSEPAAVESWRARWRRELGENGHDEKAIAGFLEPVEKHGELLEEYSFLYRPSAPGSEPEPTTNREVPS